MDGGMMFALDEGSVRRYDADGRLHVDTANICKACISPYVGHEIPDWQSLGLDPDRIYQLFRDPAEMEKSVGTFNNIPVLSKHVAASADDFPQDLVVGTTGSEASFSHPHIRNSLAIWPKAGISAVESGAQRQLSPAYRYRADMTPGEFEGQKFDGVMRDIVGNHVAIVPEGRQGNDVVIGDSNEELSIAMSKNILKSAVALMSLGALTAFVAPKLAQDAKVDFRPLLKDLTSKNIAERKAAIVLGITELCKDKLAKDASIGDVAELLDTIEAHGMTSDEDGQEVDPALVADPDTATDDDMLGKVKAFLKAAGVADEILAKLDGVIAADEPEPFPGMPEVGGKMVGDKDPKEGEKDMVDKPAMDAAIKAATEAVEKRQRGIRDAERAVRPYVGELAVAFDSGEAVYRHALKMLGVKDHATIHESALPTILGMQKKPGEKERATVSIAQDSASVTDFNKAYPNAARIGAA